MKVRLRMDTIDGNGDTTTCELMAVMERRKSDYKLVYMETVSDDGDTTSTEMYLSPIGMRIVRRGYIESDFMYERDTVHNTAYKTVYGVLPITIETNEYSFTESLEDESISAHVDYTMTIAGEQPLGMQVKIGIGKYE